jgi:hypothetical protein
MMKRMCVGSGVALVLCAGIAIAGCGGENKSPFATDNVSVAPQVEGRAPAPTPIEPPAPPIAEPTAETPSDTP